MWDPALADLHQGPPRRQADDDRRARSGTARVAEAIERRRPLIDESPPQRLPPHPRRERRHARHRRRRLRRRGRRQDLHRRLDPPSRPISCRSSSTGSIRRRSIIRFARSVEQQPDLGLVEGAPLHGPPPDEPVMFLENDLTFEAHPTTGQKTGHFLDQRDNRAKVRGLAEGRRVLDVFSCTGGFSVHAAAGGATEVHSVDLVAPGDRSRRRATWRHNAGPPGGRRLRPRRSPRRRVRGHGRPAPPQRTLRSRDHRPAVVRPASGQRRRCPRRLRAALPTRVRPHRRRRHARPGVVLQPGHGRRLLPRACTSRPAERVSNSASSTEPITRSTIRSGSRRAPT